MISKTKVLRSKLFTSHSYMVVYGVYTYLKVPNFKMEAAEKKRTRALFLSNADFVLLAEMK